MRITTTIEKRTQFEYNGVIFLNLPVLSSERNHKPFRDLFALENLIVFLWVPIAKEIFRPGHLNDDLARHQPTDAC
jgi:hypothetical protein